MKKLMVCMYCGGDLVKPKDKISYICPEACTSDDKKWEIDDGKNR